MTTPVPEPIEITPEIRLAVLRAECEAKGHEIALNQMLTTKNVGNRVDIGANDEGKLPHIYCLRCDRVWLLIDEPSDDYEEAEEKVFQRMKDTDPGRERLKAMRERRKQKLEEAKAKREEARNVGHGHGH